LDDPVLWPYGRRLDDGLAKIAFEQLQPPVRLEWRRKRRKDPVVAALCRSRPAQHPAVLAEKGLDGIAGKSASPYSADILVQQPVRKQLPNEEAQPAGSGEMVHVCEAVRIDPRQKRNPGRDFAEIFPFKLNSRRGCNGYEVQRMVGRPSCGDEADNAVDD